MEKEYDLLLVLGSFLISFIASLLAIAFASFIVWNKRNHSKSWFVAAAINMGLGIWAMHFVGMLALHIDTPVAFEVYRTAFSALLAIIASYLAFWTLLSNDREDEKQRLFYGTIGLGTGVAGMHYLGMDAMQMLPRVEYDPTLFLASLVIAYSASFVGLKLFLYSAQRPKHSLLSWTNLGSGLVIGLAVAGMHYTAMAAAQFDPSAYCTVLDSGIAGGNLSMAIVASILTILLLSFVLLAYEQNIEVKQSKHHETMLQKVQEEVEKRTEELQQQISMNERLLETMDAIVVVMDNGGIQQFNLAAQLATGYGNDEIKGEYVWDRLLPKEVIYEVKAVFSSITAGMFPNQYQNKWVKKNGEHITIDWHNSALLDETGQVTHVIGTGIDITQSLKDQEALKLSAVAFETQEALVVTDPEGFILKVNKAFEEITGYSMAEAVGQKMSILKSGKHDFLFYQQVWGEVDRSGYWQGEIWNKRKNDEIYPEWLRITRVADDDGNVINYIGNFSDISQRKQIEEELEQLAFFDAVTGLPNRRLLMDRLQQTVRGAKQFHHSVGLLFIDLDNFKTVNDTFGHSFGDELLKSFAHHLKELVPDEMTISRFGGDEFVLFFAELPEAQEAASFQCERMAETLMRSLEKGLLVKEKHIDLAASVGITVSNCQEDDEQSLLMQADTAMYQAKSMGKNTFRFYSRSIGASMAERFQLEGGLRKELKKPVGENDLFVVYQPQYDINQNIMGAEALVRWQSEEFGFIPPFQFVPIAEESGLIDELGMQVVEQVLDDINCMEALFDKSSLQRISINLSIKQLTNPNLANRLLKVFKEKKVSPKRVRFEFTESAFLDNAVDPKTLFSEMSAIGFTFALDDFGTGFSSLAYLKELPISELKIDKSFIDGIPGDESDETICSATIDMAQKLGLEVVAEGVEYENQFQWLVEHGCDMLQGYLFSKPVVYDEFIKLFK